MAGTRGIAQFRGLQMKDKLMRDRHFDVDNKINENKIDIKWHQHREILEDTKIDVFVQSNDNTVSGISSYDITDVIGGQNETTDNGTEGVVTGIRVPIRENGTEDKPVADADGDPVYGKVRYDSDNNTWHLDFFSTESGSEQAFTMPSDTVIDFSYIKRTNMSVIPVDALRNGGAGFVEGATDAKAYMNLEQLKNDLYGGAGTLDDDGNANLGTNIVQQIADEITNRQDADQAIRDDLSSTSDNEGAHLVGVVTDPNYSGLTVQGVLTELAQRLTDEENKTAALTQELDDRTKELESVGVESGGIVSAQETPDMTVNVDPVVVYNDEGKRFAVESAATATVPAADGTNARKDIVVVDNAGQVQLVKGTASSTPVTPSLPDGAVLLAEVDVPANDTSIEDTQITDKREMVATGHEVQDARKSAVKGKDFNSVDARFEETEQEIKDTHSRDADTTNGYFTTGGFGSAEGRIDDIEAKSDETFQDHEDRITELETEDDEEVFEATGGETSYTLNNSAKAKSLVLFLNGAAQAPGINYERVTDGDGNITEINFDPETLVSGDILYMTYKKSF